MPNRIDKSQPATKNITRILSTLSLLVILAVPVFGQTLFTYDGKEVSKDDFLKAYRKNNTAQKNPEKSYRDYLELYIRYKLKVQAAYDAKMDTLPSQSSELQTFRGQVVENFMSDRGSVDKLVREAFVRGQKDIHLEHIFVGLPSGASPGDTAKAWQKITTAYEALRQGKDFGETAVQYSEDPFASANRGDLGYITVFTLPHDLENVAYSTPQDHYSRPFRTKGGYHIFRNAGERRSLGKMKVAQILLAFPLHATDSEKDLVKQRADSIYKLIQRGANFAEAAKEYSGDNLSYQTGGEIAPFGVGRYDPAFEKAAFALGKDGAISAPVLTPYGYHIIRRLGREPFPRDTSKEVLALLRQEVMGDSRIEDAKKEMLAKILVQTGFSRATVNDDDLRVYTDSALRGKTLTGISGLNEQTVLFSFAKKSKTVKDWIDYLKVVHQMPGGEGKRTRKELFGQFIQSSAYDYYRDHLEEYNKDFAFQLNEFREGNLLFEVMQHTIWDKASSDSASLKAYYDSHMDKYWWEASADAVLFTAADEKAANDLKARLGQDPGSWKKWIELSGGLAQADSGRFELTQISVPGKTHFSAGMLTSFVNNPADNTVGFAYILQVYPDRAPRNYKDARGFVINDYQGWLEDQWIGELKRKYPVRIDERVFASLPK